MSGILFVLGLLSGLVAWVFLGRRQDAPRRAEAARQEQAHVDQARAEEQRAGARADAQAQAAKEQRPAEFFNDFVRRRGGPLCLALALLLPLQARADCVEDARTGAVTCDQVTARAMQLGVVKLELDLAKALAAAHRAEEERDAARAHAAVLAQLPPPEPGRPWLWAAGGVGVGLTVAMVLVAVAR